MKVQTVKQAKEKDNLNIPMSAKWMEFVIKNLLTEKTLGLDNFSYQFKLNKAEKKSFLYQLFHKVEEWLLCNSFYKANIILILKS